MKQVWSMWKFLIPFLLVAGIGCQQPTSPDHSSQTPGDSDKVRLEALSQAIGENPKESSLYHERASLYLMEGELNMALSDINQAIALDSRNPGYYLTLSDIQLIMGQSSLCMAAINQALSLDPANREASLRLAKLHLILRNYAATMRILNEMIQADPINPKAFFLRAIARLEEGDTAKAVGDLMKAVDQDQAYYEAYVQLGELFGLRNDPLAEAYLQNALKIYPQSTEALYMLGLYYQNSGQYEKAFSTYDSLFSIDSTFRSALFNKGYIALVYQDDLPAAIAFFSEAIALDSTYVDAWFNRGYSHELNGDYGKAASDYQKVLDLEVNNERAIEGLNRLDVAAGNR